MMRHSGYMFPRLAREDAMSDEPTEDRATPCMEPFLRSVLDWEEQKRDATIRHWRIAFGETLEESRQREYIEMAERGLYDG
jgi:hypothetical protein